MSPLLGFSISDAPFSLGYTLAKVGELPICVYACMNGKTFSPNEVAKDVNVGRFYSVFQDK